MGTTKLWLVVKQDTIITATGYIVRAHSAEDAEASVNAGMYIEETKAEVLDNIESTTVDVVEIAQENTQKKESTAL
jgi:hypothetical protein